jgi:uncharacterized protein YpbB
MENLKKIIKELLSYKKEFGLDTNDNHIFECATRIFISQNISNHRQEQKTSDLTKRLHSLSDKPSFVPATKSQITRLKKEGYTEEQISKMSKQDAWKIIKKLEEKNGRNEF